MEISNLLKAEFKKLVIGLLKELSEDINSVKKKKIWSETKATPIETENNLQGNNSRVDEAENQINDLEHKEGKKVQFGTIRRKKNPKTKDRLRSIWHNFKCTNIQITGLPEGVGKGQEIENLFEKIMKENFPNLVNEIDKQVQEA